MSGIMVDSRLEIDAVKDSLPKVLAFVEDNLEKAGCSMKAQMQSALAVEEIFINIVNYAYPQKKGKASVSIRVSGKPAVAEITFADRGIPYDPLEKSDPDITLSARERKVGGLGIFLVKKNVDSMSYEYRDGQNILTLKKKI